MSKTLVAVLAHSEVAGTLARHWPWYERSCCDILGVGRTDRQVTWPHPEGTRSFVGSIRIGTESRAQGSNHPERLLKLLSWFISASEYDDICVIEYDGIFLRPLPRGGPGTGFETTPAGGGGDGFAPCTFFHTPWWFNRSVARQVIEYGERMLKMNIFEGGFLDRWLGLMVELYRLPWTPAFAFSVNSLDRPEYIDHARKVIAVGCYYVHGVKTPDQLHQLTHDLPTNKVEQNLI